MVFLFFVTRSLKNEREQKKNPIELMVKKRNGKRRTDGSNQMARRASATARSIRRPRPGNKPAPSTGLGRNSVTSPFIAPVSALPSFSLDRQGPVSRGNSVTRALLYLLHSGPETFIVASSAPEKYANTVAKLDIATFLLPFCAITTLSSS